MAFAAEARLSQARALQPPGGTGGAPTACSKGPCGLEGKGSFATCLLPLPSSAPLFLSQDWIPNKHLAPKLHLRVRVQRTPPAGLLRQACLSSAPHSKRAPRPEDPGLFPVPRVARACHARGGRRRGTETSDGRASSQLSGHRRGHNRRAGSRLALSF